MGLQMKYFVLKPSGDSPYAIASRDAMIAYADSIEHENPQLAADLNNWVMEETGKMNEIYTNPDDDDCDDSPGDWDVNY